MITKLVHKITAFVLVFILFAHNINTLIIIGDFLVHQAAIAKNLCIEKDDQQGCNGKCQLTEQLKQNMPDSNTDLPAQEIRRLSLDVYCLLEMGGFKTMDIGVCDIEKTTFKYLKRYTVRYPDIDTPPPNFS